MQVATSSLPRFAQRDPFAIFLFLSVLFHLLFFLFFPAWQRQESLPPIEQLAEVELLPPFPQRPPTTKTQPPPAVAKEKPEVREKPEAQEKPEEEKPEQKQAEALKEQIVNPPDNTNDQIPEKTRLLSDRNSATKEQTVAVGNPLPAPPQKEQTQRKDKLQEKPDPPKPEQAQPKNKPQEKPAAQKPPTQLAMKPPEVQPTPKSPLEKSLEKALGKPAAPQEIVRENGDQPQKNLAPGKSASPARTPQLFARPDELLSQGWISDDEGDREAQKAERQSPQGRDLIALAPPPTESFLNLPGAIGTPDLLPDVRQGSMTFLNTKAHRFAPFVRRVAMRVFQHLIIHQRKQLTLDEVVAAKEMVTIQARLDPKGNLVKLIIQTRSGSHAVDASLLEACKQGAWDENPPPEALSEDGNLNFIFRSDISPQYDQLGLRAILSVLQVGLL
ncbi:MAG: hypothetical protein HYZ50_08500 [Deltaproteobacteria bacterium]|nr:hypothetical protein [Deltaproteobacteria bacterium]